MIKFFCMWLVLIFACTLHSDAFSKEDVEDICVDTAFVLIGGNHKVCVSTFQDPAIPEVVCKISQARTGGIKGSIGIAEDIAHFSISCVKTSDVKNIPKLPEKEAIFKHSTSLFFKKTKVIRMFQNNIATYLAISDKLIEGSPFNAVSAVYIGTGK